MNLNTWKNTVTRECYIEVLEDWEDPLGIAKEWLEMSSTEDAIDAIRPIGSASRSLLRG